MAVFSEGGVTSPDIYIGVSCICLLLFSTVLNSRVFYHNYRKHSSVARTLYLCLSATDLIASWVLLGSNAVNVLKDKDKECKNSQSKECNKNYYWGSVPSNFGMRLFTVITFSMSFAPAHITAFLAMTRFLKIRYPFLQIKIKHVISSLLFSVIWIPIVVSCAMFVDSGQLECGPIKRHIAPFSWNYCPIIFGFKVSGREFFFALVTIPLTLQAGAMVASVLTTYELIKVYLNPVSEGAGGEENRMKSSMKILLTNLGSFIHVLIIVATSPKSGIKLEDDAPIHVAMTYVLFQDIIPAVISTLNPIIYIILTPDCGFKLAKCSKNSGKIIPSDHRKNVINTRRATVA